ncbi:MAG: hypothetical protein EAX86_03400 [Candidatus Heimdallarchaeota archaeon]|nr:hypothetical protein [Candidatus Heimdallarchaeota archaeon]
MQTFLFPLSPFFLNSLILRKDNSMLEDTSDQEAGDSLLFTLKGFKKSSLFTFTVLIISFLFL